MFKLAPQMLPLPSEWSIRLSPLWRIVLLYVEPTVHENKNRQIIAVTATFTAEPVEESLNFWLSELDVPCVVKFDPYNQVFQQLLDPASTLSTNQGGLNVVLIRLEDWWRGAGDLYSGHDGRRLRGSQRRCRRQGRVSCLCLAVNTGAQRFLEVKLSRIP